MASKMHQFARAYVEKFGFKVFPLLPRDKRPLTSHGFKDASSNLEQIDRWWQANPMAGVGIPTGQVNGIVVVDFDPRNFKIEGHDDDTGAPLVRPLEDIILYVFKGMPRTWAVETPSGGMHMYFRHPGKGLLPGIKGYCDGVDIKSDGGYVVAPPSIHPNGGVYEWAERPDQVVLLDLPETLKSSLLDRKQREVARELTGTLIDGKLPEGKRNDTLTSLAGTMRRRNMDHESILAALLAENKAKCDPPLEEEEVLAIVNSVSRYEADPDASPALKQGKKRALAIGAMEDFLAAPKPVEWIIESRLAKGDCALMVGPPGSGKSWLTMALAVKGALGKPLFPGFEFEQPIRVLYVDEENPRDEVNRRMHCIFNATVQNGARPKAALDLAARLTLLEPCQGFTFREKEGWTGSFTDLVSKLEPDLIIMDSMTALSGIFDENKATEVRSFFHDVLYPVRSICNSAILVVHHSNKKAYETEKFKSTTKDGMIRGSIDYLGASDSVMFAGVVKEEKKGRVLRRTLHQVKQRRGQEPDGINWTLEVVEDPVDGTTAIQPVPVVGAEPESTQAWVKAAGIWGKKLGGYGEITGAYAAVCERYPDAQPPSEAAFKKAHQRSLDTADEA